ncbi:MAG: FG-GAP repeat protein, partial [Thermoanaerobaculia bacterium]
TLAVGDFDDDGYPDLAIGAPWEDFANVLNSGAVSVHYGGPGGLGTRIDGYTQGGGTVPDELAVADQFGKDLAAGDFDGDGIDDLAIGAWDAVGGVAQAGSVTVLYGAPGGLSDFGGAQWWTQASSGVSGSPANNDYFGGHLVAGDFNGDGDFDLAIGATNDDEAATNAGSVTVLYGSPAGLVATGIDYLTSATITCASVDSGEGFGSVLAAGDFDADGDDDLVLGVPEESHFPGNVTIANAGMVIVLPGASTGGVSSATAFCLWPGIAMNGGTLPGVRQANARFGTSLATGNVNRDVSLGQIQDDLAIGEPFADVDGEADAGEIYLVGGSVTGLTAALAARFDRGDLPGEDLAIGGYFGRKMAMGRPVPGGSADLLVQRTEGGGNFAGTVTVVPGSSGGLVLSQAIALSSADPGLLVAPAETDDFFGEGMAIGDFDADGFREFAISAPGKTAAGVDNAGAVLVLRGALFTDDFESGDDRRWSVSAP